MVGGKLALPAAMHCAHLTACPAAHVTGCKTAAIPLYALCVEREEPAPTDSAPARRMTGGEPLKEV